VVERQEVKAIEHAQVQHGRARHARARSDVEVQGRRGGAANPKRYDDQRPTDPSRRGRVISRMIQRDRVAHGEIEL
jgi:hypothetical protein